MTVVSAPYRLEDLSAVRDAIEEARDELESGGIHVTRLAINERTGLVDVGLESVNRGESDLVRARFGPSVAVSQEDPGILFACNSRNDCGTMGGLGAEGPNGLNCSTGFIVRRNSTGGKRMLTAGHCIAHSGGFGTTNPWKNPALTVTWGKNLAYVFHDGAAMDAGYFELPTLPADRDQFFASGTGDIRDISGPIYEGGLPLGKIVYRAGRQSGWIEGEITDRNVTKDFEGTITIHNLFGFNKHSEGGDSGGGIVTRGPDATTYAAGTVVGGNDCVVCGQRTYFSTVQDIEGYFDIAVCKTNSC